MSTLSRFELPQPRNLTDDVYDLLREVIARFELIPGSWLREEALAKELNVSRITIRTALHYLVAEGLAEHIPNRGVKVALLSEDELMDVYEMRAHLERLAFESAVDHITEAELDNMEALAKPFQGEPSREAVCELVARTYDFHWTAIKASRRTQLSRILGSLLAISMSHGVIMRAYIKGYSPKEAADMIGRNSPSDQEALTAFYQDFLDVHKQGDLDHQTIVAAFRERDKGRVGQLIAKHLQM